MVTVRRTTAGLGPLANEFNHTTDLRVHVRIAMPQRDIDQGSIGHATDTETSLMMYLCPQAVDLKSLPPLPQPLRFSDFAIVDGPGFDGKGSPDRIVLEDPRIRSSRSKDKRWRSKPLGKWPTRSLACSRKFNEQRRDSGKTGDRGGNRCEPSLCPGNFPADLNKTQRNQ